MNRILNISEYFERVNELEGFHLAVKDFVGFLAREIGSPENARPYFIHNNPYCMYIKTNSELFIKCKGESNRLRKRCQKSTAPFIGMCYCGYSELIVPIAVGDKVIGAVCAGGFNISQKKSERRRDKVIDGYSLSKEEALYNYDLTVHKGINDIDKAIAICSIIAHYFSLHYLLLKEKKLLHFDGVRIGDTNRYYILSHAEEYIRMHYASDIHVSDIARFCCCSESYINHVFKKSTGINISNYICQVRIENAKKMIAETKQSFQDIAENCGFSDSNYFSVIFKKLTGKTPSQYRSELNIEKS